MIPLILAKHLIPFQFRDAWRKVLSVLLGFLLSCFVFIVRFSFFLLYINFAIVQFVFDVFSQSSSSIWWAFLQITIIHLAKEQHFLCSFFLRWIGFAPPIVAVFFLPSRRSYLFTESPFTFIIYIYRPPSFIPSNLLLSSFAHKFAEQNPAKALPKNRGQKTINRQKKKHKSIN